MSHAATIALGLVAAWASLAFHEAGHVLAGLAAGFRFELFVLGPLSLRRSADGRVRPGINREWLLFGGAGGTAPTSTAGLRPRFVAVVAGGPAANLLMALVAHGLLAAGVGSPAAVRVMLGWLRLLSAAVAVGTLLPLPMGPLVSDGLRLWRLLGGGPRAAREVGLLTWTAQATAGIRPADRDETALTAVLAVHDGSMFECQGWLWACERARDLGRLAEAGAALARARELAVKAPAELQAACEREAAYLAAPGDAGRGAASRS